MAYDASIDQGHRDYWNAVAKSGQSQAHQHADVSVLDGSALSHFDFFEKDRAIHVIANRLRPILADSPGLSQEIMELVARYDARISEDTHRNISSTPSDHGDARAAIADTAILEMQATMQKRPSSAGNFLAALFKQALSVSDQTNSPTPWHKQSFRLGNNLR